MTAWPCSFPGHWCAVPLCCPLSPAGLRSGGQWAVGRSGEYRRRERGRSVSGGPLQAGGRTGRPAWPAAARSWPHPSAGRGRGWAPHRSPPPESRWSYEAGPSWSQSFSVLAVPWRSSCTPFSGRKKRSVFRYLTFKWSHTNIHGVSLNGVNWGTVWGHYPKVLNTHTEWSHGGTTHLWAFTLPINTYKYDKSMLWGYLLWFLALRIYPQRLSSSTTSATTGAPHRNCSNAPPLLLSRYVALHIKQTA